MDGNISRKNAQEPHKDLLRHGHDGLVHDEGNGLPEDEEEDCPQEVS